VGTTPFRGEGRNATFTHILHAPLTFPESVSLAGPPKPVVSGDGGVSVSFWNPISSHYRAFVAACLDKNAATRLGSASGASQVKGHPLFRDTAWALLRHRRPPFVPEEVSEDPDALHARYARNQVRESFTVDWEGGGGVGHSRNLERQTGVLAASTLPSPPTSARPSAEAAHSSEAGVAATMVEVEGTKEEGDPFAGFDSISVIH
jgi:protein-serine/threonine kinase